MELLPARGDPRVEDDVLQQMAWLWCRTDDRVGHGAQRREVSAVTGHRSLRTDRSV